MKTNARFITFFAFFVMIFLLITPVHGAVPIAKITGFDGEVIVQSGVEISAVTDVGLGLKHGDRIQTKEGEVQITFNDGAIMKINPFTSTMIQEREEERGLGIFKTKKAVRRITCFIGKLWFKSGSSQRRNYLQTPTAVCGLRGSDGDVGFDNLNTYLNMYSGEAEVVGDAIRGFFENPGMSVAAKNAVYNALGSAYTTSSRAGETGSELDLARAKASALQVIEAAGKALENSPDEQVASDARQDVERARTELEQLKKVIIELEPAEELIEETPEATTTETKEEETTKEATTVKTTTSTSTTTTTSEESTVSPCH